jgi:hypothetical protein
VSLAYVRTTPRVSMGALLPYTDTGGGITPANFQAMCCTGILGTYPHAGSGDACDLFQQANASLFGDEVICSTASIANLTMPPPVTTVATPAPPINPSGSAIVPLVACPASISPCPCDGRLVVTTQDAADLLTCQALAQSMTQGAAVQTQMNANAAAQCAAQTLLCAQNLLMRKMNTDCVTCGIDFTSPTLWMAALAIGAIVWFATKLP